MNLLLALLNNVCMFIVILEMVFNRVLGLSILIVLEVTIRILAGTTLECNSKAEGVVLLLECDDTSFSPSDNKDLGGLGGLSG